MINKLKDFKVAGYFALSALALVAISVLIYVSVTTKFFSENKTGVLTKTPSDSEAALNAWREAKGQIKVARKLDKTDFVVGKSKDLEMIVYYDFECPFSARFHEVVKKVIAKFGNDLKIGFRNFPLETHEHAVNAAIAFECAVKEDKGMEMMNLLFANQEHFGKDETVFVDLAKQLGLNETKFSKCFNSVDIKNKVVNQKDEAKTFDVIGTPHFFLNGKGYPGSWQLDDFTDSTGYKHEGLNNIIDNLLKKR